MENLSLGLIIMRILLGIHRCLKVASKNVRYAGANTAILYKPIHLSDLLSAGKYLDNSQFRHLHDQKNAQDSCLLRSRRSSIAITVPVGC